MFERFRHPLTSVSGALLFTVPFIVLFVTHGYHLIPSENIAAWTAVLVGGLAILGAAFLLAWAAETAEKDVPTAFAIAVLAVLAVAPEYAVDALYAWQAGADPGPSEAARLAIANMTGANRILIGIGWSGIALYTIYRAKRIGDSAVEHRSSFLGDVVTLDRDIGLEIVFLLAATVFAFFVPFGGAIGMIDTVVLVGLYVLYISVIIRGDVDEGEEHVGVPAYFQQYAKRRRIAVVVFLFAFSGLIIYEAVHPFANGLEQLGIQYGIPKFFMIQWLAPLASESPELIVVAYLVNKGRSTAGFNALISSKLNQWTLLIGTLAVVFSIAAGHIHGLPLDSKQVAEIWITAAQSFFALMILMNFEISVREAIVLLFLFVSQVLIEFLIIVGVLSSFPFGSIEVLYIYTAIYMVLGFGLLARRRESFRQIIGQSVHTIQTAFAGGDDQSSSTE